MKRALVALVVLALGILACRLSPAEPRKLDLYPSETPNATQTPLVVQITTTLNATQTPNVVIVSATPNALGTFCVSALVAVHLRPSPNADNYPITVLPNGTVLKDLGGRSGSWMFVAVGDEQGWVNSGYLTTCA